MTLIFMTTFCIKFDQVAESVAVFDDLVEANPTDVKYPTFTELDFAALQKFAFQTEKL